MLAGRSDLRIRFGALVAAICLLSPLGVFARGEISYRLPEVQKRVGSSNVVIRKSSWSLASDTSTNDIDDVAALGSDVVALIWRGKICGFNELSGYQRWCAESGSGPAYASHKVAYVTPSGIIRAVDASSGALLWQYKMQSATRLDRKTSRIQRVWPASKDFLFWTLGSNRLAKFGEIGVDGSLLWLTRLPEPVQKPRIVDPYALQLQTSTGATQNGVLQTLRLGRYGGGLGSRFTDVFQVLDIRLPRLVMIGDWRLEEVQDRFLTVDVETADITTGEIEQRFHFEPDYDANDTLYNGNTFAGQGSPQTVVDGDKLYAIVANKLYRYRLAIANGQRPLLMATDVVSLLGASKGAVYVARKAGVWKLFAAAGTIQAQRIVTAAGPVSAFAIFGHTVFLGSPEGRLYGVDVNTGRMTYNAKSCIPDRIMASPHRVYTLCSSRFGYEIFAFPRFD